MLEINQKETRIVDTRKIAVTNGILSIWVVRKGRHHILRYYCRVEAGKPIIVKLFGVLEYY